MNYDAASEGIDLVYTAIVKYCEAYEKANRDKEETDEFYFYLAGLDKALEIIDNYDLSKNLACEQEIEWERYAEWKREVMLSGNH